MRTHRTLFSRTHSYALCMYALSMHSITHSYALSCILYALYCTPFASYCTAYTLYVCTRMHCICTLLHSICTLFSRTLLCWISHTLASQDHELYHLHITHSRTHALIETHAHTHSRALYSHEPYYVNRFNITNSSISGSRTLSSTYHALTHARTHRNSIPTNSVMLDHSNTQSPISHPPKNGLIALQTPRTCRLSTFYYCQVVNRAFLRLLSTYI